MLNFEKYKDEIENYDVQKGALHCYLCKLRKAHCDSYTHCDVCLKESFKFLYSDYKEPIKLTKFEFDFLKNIDPKVIWIARNDRGNLEGFIDKPKKYACEWQKIINGESHFYKLSAFNHLFPFIKWEDEEATNIKKLLENCEVIGDD